MLLVSQDTGEAFGEEYSEQRHYLNRRGPQCFKPFNVFQPSDGKIFLHRCWEASSKSSKRSLHLIFFLCTCIFSFFEARMGKNKTTSPVHLVILEQFCHAWRENMYFFPRHLQHPFEFQFLAELGCGGRTKETLGAVTQCSHLTADREASWSHFQGRFPLPDRHPFPRLGSEQKI